MWPVSGLRAVPWKQYCMGVGTCCAFSTTPRRARRCLLRGPVVASYVAWGRVGGEVGAIVGWTLGTGGMHVGAALGVSREFGTLRGAGRRVGAGSAVGIVLGASLGSMGVLVAPGVGLGLLTLRGAGMVPGAVPPVGIGVGVSLGRGRAGDRGIMSGVVVGIVAGGRVGSAVGVVLGNGGTSALNVSIN